MTEDPLDVLWLAIAGRGLLLVRFPTEPEPVRWEPAWLDAEDREGVLGWWRGIGHGTELYTSLCLRFDEDVRHRAIDGANVLWAAGQGEKFAAALRAFKPRPTVVVREGQTTRYAAVWALSGLLERRWLEQANRRLSAHLGGKSQSARPDYMMRVPGSLVKYGRRDPLRVRAHAFPELYDPAEVVGRLRDGPDPNAWRKRNR